MKGQASELMNITILIASIIVIMLLTHFLFSKTSLSLMKNLVTESRYETVIDMTTAFYNTKVSGTHRTLSQLTGDRIVAGQSSVPYGIGFGLIDVDDQLHDFFSTYLGTKWALVYDGSEGFESFELGYDIPSFGQKVIYNILVPLPSIGTKIVSLRLYTW